MNKKIIYVSLAAVLSSLVLWQADFGGGEGGNEDLPMFETLRGDLVIHVLEGGNIRAMEYLEIKNEVKISATTKILTIVDEGYEVTEQDVKDGKVLIRLDPVEIEEQIVGFDVDFQQTEATYAADISFCKFCIYALYSWVRISDSENFLSHFCGLIRGKSQCLKITGYFK